MDYTNKGPANPMNDRNEENHNDEDEYVSRSQLKREANALQSLGEELVKLPASKLAKIPLPENLSDAIHEAHNIKSRGAHKRQLQYIGKIMRHIDAEPIRKTLDKLKDSSRQASARLHRLEEWRDRLIDEGDSVLAELLEERPQADRQHLRQLVRNAIREHKQNKPPRSAREIFRYLRELFED